MTSTAVAGIIASLRVTSTAVTGFTGLKAESGRGLTEIRVSVGAVFVGLGVAALALNTPVAYRTLGIMYLAMAVVRVPPLSIPKYEAARLPLSAIVANGFDGTAFLGLFAARFLVGRGGLLIDEGVAAVFVALEIVRGRLAAQVAVNALVVHVEFAGDVFGVFVCSVSHNVIKKS